MSRFAENAKLALCALAVLNARLALADIKPGSLFTDNAVIQQQMPIPIWGTAEPSEPITVNLNGQSANTTAGPDGNWSVKLPSMAAGGPYELTISGAPPDRLTLHNIYVGEVWLCGGQSNMEYPLEGLKPPVLTSSAIPTANDPLIHFVIVPKTIGIEPRASVACAWRIAAPDTVAKLTAVGYFFARGLRAHLGVPIGLISDNWGGTPAQAWTSREALEAVPELRHYVELESEYQADYPHLLEQYNAALAKSQADPESEKGEAGPSTGTEQSAPTKPVPYERWPSGAAHLYNGMIAPIIPYGICGVIWYQGEANGSRGYEYKTLFPALIADWRSRWGEGDFPFLYVQLAPFFRPRATPLPSGKNSWADLREAQRLTLTASPNTGMAVITDLGDIQSVHPPRKEPVGERLALIARALAYHENIEYSGPVVTGVDIEGASARVNLSHAEGLKTIDVHDCTDDGPLMAGAGQLCGFEVAGADHVYRPANALIDGSSVVVTSPEVPAPVAVRYGWADYPIANLVNSAGLPASPFKSDDWPWASQPKGDSTPTP